MAKKTVNYDLKPRKNLILNPFQFSAAFASQIGVKYKTYLVGRGGGKSTVLGWDMMTLASAMPRSTGVLVGETYQQILSRTLPSTKEGMAMFGVYEGIDYVVGKKGKGFRMPFQAPDRWSNVIHFRNGTIVIMVSLDMPDAGRGINSFWVIGDEAALLDKERLFTNVQTTNRSVKEEFINHPLLNSEVFATSMPLTRKGKWILELEKKYQTDDFYKNQKTLYLKATSSVNKNNLAPGWLARMRAEASSDIVYEAEILNIEPPSVLNGFYKFFSEKNTYGRMYNLGYLLNDVGVNYNKNEHDNCKQDRDLIPGVPLEISIDPGQNINSMTVWQFNEKEYEDRCLKEFFVKGKKDYIDLCREFDKYYHSHKLTEKTLFLRHDVTAYKERDKNNLQIAEAIQFELQKLGWRVVNMTPRTNNPGHTAKFTVLNTLLKGAEPSLPKIKFNRDNCKNTIVSMENAETDIKKNTGFGKDKSSEVSTTILQEHATHLSDTVDYHLYWKYVDRVESSMQKVSNFGMKMRRR